MVSRSEIITKLEARLSGVLSDSALAAWAFDRFYAEELGEEEFAEEDAEVVRMVLDDLMFADDPAFALDEAALRDLLARLQVS